MRAIHVADEIGLDDTPMRLDGRFLEAADGAHAHIIDPNVKVAEALYRRTRKSAHGGGIRDVCGHRFYQAAFALTFRGYCLQGLPAARGQHQIRTLPRQELSRGPADSARRSG
jgi:hypothetical protein